MDLETAIGPLAWFFLTVRISMNLFRKRAAKDVGSISAPADPQHQRTPLPPVAEFLQLAGRRSEPGAQEVHDALRELQILLHNKRLYHHTHPKTLDSLNQAYESLQRLAQAMNGVEIRVVRDGMVLISTFFLVEHGFSEKNHAASGAGSRFRHPALVRIQNNSGRLKDFRPAQ